MPQDTESRRRRAPRWGSPFALDSTGTGWRAGRAKRPRRRARHGLRSLAWGLVALCLWASIHGDPFAWAGDGSTRPGATSAAKDAVDLFEEALALARLVDPTVDGEASRRAFHALTTLAARALRHERSLLGRGLTPVETVSILNHEVLLRTGLRYRARRYEQDALFTTALTSGRGNCLATALLYALVADAVNQPITLALLPTHAVARWEDHRDVFNIETTRAGTMVADRHALAQQGLTEADRGPNHFLVGLRGRALLSHLCVIHARILASMERTTEAERLLARAARLEPDLPHLQLEQALFDGWAGRLARSDASLAAWARRASGPWYREQVRLRTARRLAAHGDPAGALRILAPRLFLPGAGRSPGAGSTGGVREGLAGLAGRRALRADAACYLGRLRRWTPALAQARAVAMEAPSVAADLRVGDLLAGAGRLEEARAVYRRALSHQPSSPVALLRLAGVTSMTAWTERDRAALAAALQPPATGKLPHARARAVYHARHGETEAMLAAVADALRMDRSGDTAQALLADPAFDPYRHLPAMRRLLPGG